jgi:hypothetical protein
MFSSYWKEIAIVLAAAFAILGAIFDVKDKRTNRITAWGRVFFALTVLSMIGGFYAQWEQSAAEEQRSGRAQAQMIQLLEKSEKSLREMSRLLQPFERPKVTLFLKPECAEPAYALFCASARAAGKKIHGADKSIASLNVTEGIDWATWPSRIDYIGIAVVKNPGEAEAYLNGCIKCPFLPDLHLDLFLLPRRIR